jgi:hypothetical protein
MWKKFVAVTTSSGSGLIMAPKWCDLGRAASGQVAGFERRFNKFGIDRKATKQVVRCGYFGLSFSVVEWFQEHFLQHSLVRCVPLYGDQCVTFFLFDPSIFYNDLFGRDRYFCDRSRQQSPRARSQKSLPSQMVLQSRQRHILKPKPRRWVCG